MTFNCANIAKFVKFVRFEMNIFLLIMKKYLIIMASAMVLSACGPKLAKVPALDLSNLDTTVSPAADFYQYSTGGWQKNNPLKS